MTEGHSNTTSRHNAVQQPCQEYAGGYSHIGSRATPALQAGHRAWRGACRRYRHAVGSAHPPSLLHPLQSRLPPSAPSRLHHPCDSSALSRLGYQALTASTLLGHNASRRTAPAQM